MAYQFTSDLETGNITIDKQHRQLIDAINDLLEACTTGQGRTKLESTTKFLYDYTSKHFADEEKLQLSSHYPDYSNHKKYHEDFKATVIGLSKKLNEQGPTITLVGEVNNAIAGWLINHIKREDTKVAQHLRNNGQ